MKGLPNLERSYLRQAEMTAKTKYTIIELLSGFNLWSEKKFLLFGLYFFFSLIPVLGLFVIALNQVRRIKNHASVNKGSLVEDIRKGRVTPNLLPPSKNEDVRLIQTERLKVSIDKEIPQHFNNINDSSFYSGEALASSLEVIEPDVKAAEESVKRLNGSES